MHRPEYTPGDNTTQDKQQLDTLIPMLMLVFFSKTVDDHTKEGTTQWHEHTLLMLAFFSKTDDV